MAHCSIEHWADLSTENMIAARGWRKSAEELGRARFHETVDGMMSSRRPLERGAIVVAGQFFPEDEKFRAWMLRRIRSRGEAGAIAAVFGLAPHLDYDEDLSSRLTILSMKLPRADPVDATRIAIQVAIAIWVSAEGTGRCKRCGKTPG